MVDERRLILLFILSGVALAAAAWLVVGWRSQAPSGKQGLKGTGMERSRALRRFQMGLLVVLFVACLVAIMVVALT